MSNIILIMQYFLFKGQHMRTSTALNTYHEQSKVFVLERHTTNVLVFGTNITHELKNLLGINVDVIIAYCFAGFILR